LTLDPSCLLQSGAAVEADDNQPALGHVWSPGSIPPVQQGHAAQTGQNAACQGTG